jgi:hypothetical protein
MTVVMENKTEPIDLTSLKSLVKFRILRLNKKLAK